MCFFQVWTWTCGHWRQHHLMCRDALQSGLWCHAAHDSRPDVVVTNGHCWDEDRHSSLLGGQGDAPWRRRDAASGQWRELVDPCRAPYYTCWRHKVLTH
ncbi:hypothetical protein K431DRAFT_288727, partial [Polychaeton citri CBS 116435]